MYARRGWEGVVKGKRKGRREQRLLLLSQKFFQCSVYLMYSSLFSVHFWSLHFVAFSHTNWSTQPALLPRNKRNKNLNASNLPLLWFLHGPIFLVFFEQGSVFPELFTGSGGMEFQITLRFVASWFLSAADPQTRLQFFRSRKTNRVAQAVSFHPWPWGLQTIVFSISLSAAILQDHFPVHRDFLGFLRLSPSMHHHRLWCGYGCLRPSWFWWMSDLAEPDRAAVSLLIPRQSNLHTAEPSYLD